MRTTIDIPDQLVAEAMKVTNIHTKTEVIKEALIGLIQREKLKKIKHFHGKIHLEIDLDALRDR